MNRYYVSFLPFFREVFTLEAVLKRITSGFEIEEVHTFTIRIDISLCPRALLGFNDLIIFTISKEIFQKIQIKFNIKSFATEADII